MKGKQQIACALSNGAIAEGPSHGPKLPCVFTFSRLGLLHDTTRYAILTCARKPTRVSLIYRTEPATKKCKNRKIKK